jgi:hypothetical protein
VNQDKDAFENFSGRRRVAGNFEVNLEDFVGAP